MAREMGGALSIGRFVVNPAGIWQDNIPTGTYYTASLVNINGSKIAGFPQT